MKISQKELSNIILEALNEVFIDEGEVNYLELVNYCLECDFLFTVDGYRVRCANTTEMQKAIASEVLQGRLEVSHDIDSLIEELAERNKLATDDVEVIKVTLPNEKYYIIWEK